MVLAAAPASEGRPAVAGKEYAKLQHCVVSLIEPVSLPAQEAGVLIEVVGKEGTVVTQDQILARVQDRDAKVKLKAAKLKLAVAKEKATNDAEVRSAKKIVEVADAEYRESLAINKRSPGSIPDTQVRRQFLQYERALLEAAVAEMDFAVAALELKVAEVEVEAVENELERRLLKAPYDGVVVQLMKHQAEWVQPGEAVMRVVRMDRLRVEGFLNSEEYAPHHVQGARATIRVRLAGGDEETLTGTVDYVSPLVEASGDYRIWAEIDNKPGRGGYAWLVRPGSEVEMTLELKKAAIPAR
jgi:multidrug resistance efflux pump